MQKIFILAVFFQDGTSGRVFTRHCFSCSSEANKSSKRCCFKASGAPNLTVSLQSSFYLLLGIRNLLATLWFQLRPKKITPPSIWVLKSDWMATKIRILSLTHLKKLRQEIHLSILNWIFLAIVLEKNTKVRRKILNFQTDNNLQIDFLLHLNNTKKIILFNLSFESALFCPIF